MPTSKKEEGKKSWLVKRDGVLEFPGYEGTAQENEVVSEVLNLERLKRESDDIAESNE